MFFSLFRFILPPHFPSARVVDAYMNPVTDRSTEPLVWGSPDVLAIKDFMQEKVGWDPELTMRYLNPVLKVLGGERAIGNGQNHSYNSILVIYIYIYMFHFLMCSLFGVIWVQIMSEKPEVQQQRTIASYFGPAASAPLRAPAKAASSARLANALSSLGGATLQQASPRAKKTLKSNATSAEGSAPEDGSLAKRKKTGKGNVESENGTGEGKGKGKGKGKRKVSEKETVGDDAVEKPAKAKKKKVIQDDVSTEEEK